MATIRAVVDAVLAQQAESLHPSTFATRRIYFRHLVELADEMNIGEPCQELYDAFVSRASTVDLRFQLYHTVKLVDAAAGTKAFNPEGRLYNEPVLPTLEESRAALNGMAFPLEDGTLDVGFLIIRACEEMEYLQLTDSTSGQYLKAWREFYVDSFLSDDTIFTRAAVMAFIDRSTEMLNSGAMAMWKWKIRRRASLVLLEVAETGRFQWKAFCSHHVNCPDEGLDGLRLQYVAFVRSRNLEESTVSLHDYSFRCLIEETGVHTLSELQELRPYQVQQMLTSLSERLSINSRGTIFPIIRQVFIHLHAGGFISNDLSGLVLTPFNQKSHLKPYLASSDEEKVYAALKEAPYRTQAIMRLSLRLGLRDCDICDLQFSQIDWNKEQIIIEQKKTGKVIFLPLLEDVGNAILDYIENERPVEAKGYPYIFVRSQAPYHKMRSMYSICSKIYEESNVQTVNRPSRGMHVGRYTLAHDLLKAKVPHQVITDTLGHAGKESDKPYISMEEEMLRECPLDLSVIGQKYWEEGDGIV
ncbi:MAG: tyrosine-type recombinase/integrase [Clostridiales bacterium]|nr:tyrosine-type recombinase/integrase [Clostridiales bacterium]